MSPEYVKKEKNYEQTQNSSNRITKKTDGGDYMVDYLNNVAALQNIKIEADALNVRCLKNKKESMMWSMVWGK